MNIRKGTDYTALFYSLNEIVNRELSQMDLYCEIGRVISVRQEKGTAVAAAEYLQAAFPDMSGFSPRNVRRMRDFYRTYENSPNLMSHALNVGWTQNIVIMESCESDAERAWYLQSVMQFQWSKSELTAQIAANAYGDMFLDESSSTCYTDTETEVLEESHGKDFIRLPRQYLPQPHGGVYYEESGEKSWTCKPIRDFICSHQHGGNRESGLPSHPKNAGRAWDLLQRTLSSTAHQCRLRLLRSAHWYGLCKHTEYAPHLRWRFSRQSTPAVGVYRPSRRCGRPMVHPRLQCDLA